MCRMVNIYHIYWFIFDKWDSFIQDILHMNFDFFGNLLHIGDSCCHNYTCYSSLFLSICIDSLSTGGSLYIIHKHLPCKFHNSLCRLRYINCYRTCIPLDTLSIIDIGWWSYSFRLVGIGFLWGKIRGDIEDTFLLIRKFCTREEKF